MSPQFVDFNGDGHQDIVAGTFDGSPHVAFGSEKGFQQPVSILDEHGKRILINQFWNDDADKWDTTTRCDPEGHELPSGHLTSAVAFDWNGDGVFDLLLGDYTNGHLYLRENRGTNAAPKLSSTNVPVMAGGQPLKVPGKMTTMRPVDWDGDGRLDLVCGGFGDSYEHATGGGVYLFRNIGSAKEPELDAPITLIAPSSKSAASSPTRPDAGLYPDVVDWNADGRPDLVVGAYSFWTPPQRPLTDEEQARAAALRKELEEAKQKMSEFFARARTAAEGLEGEAATKKMTEERQKHAAEINDLFQNQQRLQKELDKLVAAPQRTSYVWVHLNGAGTPPAPGERPASTGGN